ncbi:MAG: M23 family metallopeptidase [Bacteroidia bacterium]|nr:M23 family metallopeptidase [Bacteroidia bacterium]
MKTEYRFSILQEETFEQLSNYKLPLWKMVGTVLGIGVLVILITLAAVVYTPLKGPVLGYVTKIETTDIVVLNQKIEELENLIGAHQTYEASIRQILMGDLNHDDLPSPPEGINSSNANTPLPTSTNFREAKETKSIMLNQKINAPSLVAFTSPVEGSISASFMPDKDHYGVDIVAPKNTAIKAIRDGFVITADWTIDTGNTIAVQHANGFVSIYKHNSALLKKAGSAVKAGEAIALIGNTGRLTDGPHLHFELWHNGKPLDPQEYFNF